MASDVDIANLALLYLGQTEIVSFLDSTERARAVNRTYAMLRDKFQRTYRWNFTRTFAQLPLSATPPLFQFAYAYQLPSDCLRIENVAIAYPSTNNPNGAIPAGISAPGTSLGDYSPGIYTEYQVVGQMIYTNYYAPLSLVYARRVTDPNAFDAGFVDAFACFLAMVWCETMTNSNTKKKDMQALLMQALNVALATKSMENAPVQIPDDTFMQSRTYS